MKIENLFPTALFQHRVSSDIADHVEELFLQNFSKLKQVETLKTDFFNSEKVFSLNEIFPLMEEIDKCLEYYCSQIKIQIPKIYNYWIQDYSENEYHPKHNHGSLSLSLVYWIRSNNKAGNFVIDNPSPYNKVFYHENDKSVYTTDCVSIPPIKGGLIIFPSFLDHEVTPGGEGCVRTALAINYIK